MAFAILRCAKLKARVNVISSARHNFREKATDNADPERTPNNKTTGAQNSKEVMQRLDARLATVPTVRKNGVLVIEYFIGASPEWFKDAGAAKREAYFDSAEAWLKARHGSENVISVTRQYDETSPHLCAYAVPIDPKGRLNCSHFMDGREMLSQMQTEFADRVGRPVQLERGIEGSTAKHQTIKSYYAKIQAPTPQLKTQVPAVQPASLAEKALEAVGMATDHSQAVQAQQLAIKRRQAEFAKVREIEQAKGKQYDIDKAANQARAGDLYKLRETSARVRELPLPVVLDRLGCFVDVTDKNNWRSPVGRISVEGSKFFNHDTNAGGGGAIDLVKHVNGLDYKDTVAWLAREFGAGQVVGHLAAKAEAEVQAALAGPPKPFELPEPVQANWPAVKDYLINKRKLAAGLIDDLHHRGQIYADRFKNAVFVLANGKGVELRGTGLSAFNGVRGQKLGFRLPGEAKKLALVESAIDAISLKQLGFKGSIVGLGGNSPELASQLAQQAREQGLEVVAAFDADEAGDRMAVRLGQSTRLKPLAPHKDWNDQLIADLAAAAAPARPVQRDTDAPRPR